MTLLICTDLDRTLIPNGPQSESELARERFSQLVKQEDILLAYVSGRDKELVRKAIKNYDLPMPNFVIGDVGTSLYQVNNETNMQAIESWQNLISEDWNNANGAELHATLSGLKPLRVQEAAKQNRFKLSYYVPLYQDFDLLEKEIQQRLEVNGYKARLVWSIDEPAGIGLLDIIPQQASKYHAIEALLTHLKLTVDQCVFCGDSGNDMDVLASPLRSVLVANAQDHIKKMAQQLVTERGIKDSLYVAKGDYLGMNGYYSAGMLEGIRHYFPDTVKVFNA